MPSPASPIISLSIPRPLLQELDARAHGQHQSRSKVIITALQHYFDQHPRMPAPQTPEELEHAFALWRQEQDAQQAKFDTQANLLKRGLDLPTPPPPEPNV